MRTSFNIPDKVVGEFDRVWQEQEIENQCFEEPERFNRVVSRFVDSI